LYQLMKNVDVILAQLGPQVPIDASTNTFGVVVVGFLFVMLVLAALSAVTTILGVCFMRQAAADLAKVAAAAERTAAQLSPAALAPAAVVPHAAPDADEEPVVIAVIAAAVHAVIGERAHHIVSIRPATGGWAQEGRRQIFSSHRVR
jgi:hypothetical protein